MTIQLGDEAPDFVAETTQGDIHFHDWKRGRWAVLVSHPANFTPVCTTELAALAALWSEFDRRDTSVMAVSADPLDTHYRWLDDIERLAGVPLAFPVAADPNRWITRLYGMIHPPDARHAVRSAYVIDREDRVRLMLAYPACTGRSFAELLRVIDSLQLADEHGIATPADWQAGQDVVIPSEISTDEAKRRFPRGIEAKTPYLRLTPDPARELADGGYEARSASGPATGPQLEALDADRGMPPTGGTGPVPHEDRRRPDRPGLRQDLWCYRDVVAGSRRHFKAREVMMSTELRDPVCGMRIDPAVPGPTVVWKGRTIRFCSERCKEEFSKDPDRHAKGV